MQLGRSPSEIFFENPMAQSDNVLTKMQDLLLYMAPQLAKFPRDYKFTLGDRIFTRLLEVQEHCVRAYYKREKRGHLEEANVNLELSRHLVRLAHSMKLFGHDRYEVIAGKTDEVGRMLGGWLKQQLSREATA